MEQALIALAAGLLAALDRSSPGGNTESSPAVANGVVYVHFNTSGPSSTIYAFDAGGTTGCSGTPNVCAALWTANTGAFGATSPAVANGVVYTSTDAQAVCLPLEADRDR